MKLPTPLHSLALAALLGILSGSALEAQSSPMPDNFVRIPGGTFMMGSPASEADRENDEVQHQVTVSSFYMGKYEVTQQEYQAVMGTNPSEFKGSNLPVELVDWYDVIEYCNKRSQREGLTPAYTINKDQQDPNNTNKYDDVKWTVTWNRSANGYRLPTEAEWEYACRAGTTTPFNTGSNITTNQGSNITTNQANYNGKGVPWDDNYNPKGTFREKTTPVGSFAPNAWGLYDMHGNVQEWCWDWYGSYSGGAQTDPVGPSAGAVRIHRGEDFCGYVQSLRSVFRSFTTPEMGVGYVGFRLVRPVN